MWQRFCQSKFTFVLILSLILGWMAVLPQPHSFSPQVQAQVSLIPILFDNTKAETAGNADWIIDVNQPTPSPSNPTTETSWVGAISSWGVELVKSGKYSVSTLPSTGQITYGDASNPQDLSKYKVFVIPEPNTAFTASEKSAIINFVDNGGGLFMVADHLNSDRNNDGTDSPRVFNDLMNNNSRGVTDIFGIQYDLNNISSENPSTLSNDPNDPIIFGSFGVVSGTIFRAGSSMTINTTHNANARGVIFRNTFSNTGSTGVAFARSQFGQGRIAANGDSSAIDDGTGQPGNTLFNGWLDPAATNRQLFLNATEWLANSTSQASFTLSSSPTSQTINAGTSVTYNVSVTPQSGFSGMVTLSVSGLPTGATASFSSNPVAAGSSSTLTINTTSSTTTGTVTLNITGTSNNIIKNTTASLTINPLITPDYSISLSPNNKSIVQGSSSSLTVATTSIGGFTTPITLSASSLPSGVTASFSTNPVTPGSSTTLTLTATSSATTGTFTVNVNGIASSLSRTAPLSLTITPGSVERLTNGGFEGSTSPWVLTGSSFYTASGAYPHSGTGYVNTGNTNNTTGIVYQQFTIPTTATTANLSFWLNVSSTETSTTTAFDKLYVEVYNSSGTLLQTLATYSNLNKSADGVYFQKSGFSLLSYKGQTIRIQFRGVNGSVSPTIFRIDDVSVK